MSASVTLVCDAIGSRHQFGSGGGAFGRSRKCDWILPDPDRHLSSVHARVVFQNGAFVLVDESTNGTFLEGQPSPIGRGRAVSLSPGMKLQAGPYLIRVDSLHSGAQESAAYTSQPFHTAPSSARTAPFGVDTLGASTPQSTSLDPLDHLGGGSQDKLTPVASAQTPNAAIPEPVTFASQVTSAPAETTLYSSTQQSHGTPPAPAPAAPPPAIDGNGFSGTGSDAGRSGPAGPLPQVQQHLTVTPPPAGHSAVPEPPAPPAAPRQPTVPAPPTASPQPAGDGIPDDFWTNLTTSAEQRAAAAAAPPPQEARELPDLSMLTQSIGSQREESAEPASGPTIPDHVDFGLGVPQAPASPSPRLSTELQPAPAARPAPPPQPLPGPQSVTPAPASAPPQQAPMPPFPPAPLPAGQDQSAALNPLEVLKKRREQREAELAQKAKARSSQNAPDASAPVPAASASSALAKAPAARGSTPQAADSPDVFQALLSGLGFSNASVPEDEQAEIAKAAGEMVRELANGLIALLAARKSLKSEFRMYETRIQPEENNPFKHFNVGELAIDEMLFARKGGFLAPADAAKEAFKDLQNHSMTTVAATQRAMRLLFETLSPEALAGEDDDGGLRLKGLGSRRGKWDTAKEKHDRLRADFDSLVRQTIAEAFVQVEEEQARQQSKTFWENRKK